LPCCMMRVGGGAGMLGGLMPSSAIGDLLTIDG
jgi:hypothetical protein